MAEKLSAPELVLDRPRVLERISRRGSPVLVLLAPAGYGKSHIAQIVATGYEKSLYLQCERAGDLEVALTRLLEAQGSKPEDIRAAWAKHQNTALTIDNIECLKEQPSALAALRTLLESHAGGNKVLFCGRVDPGIEFAAEAPPHMITFLRSEQLAFDQAEMRDLFSLTTVDDATRYRLHLFTGGWPAAALYCAQSARSGEIDELFDSPETAFADFLDYIDANVLANLPDHVLCGLSAVVGIPGIRTQELTQLYGHKHPDVVGEMVRGYEVVSLREPAAFNVNGLLRSAVRSKRRPNVIEAQRLFGDLCNEKHEYGRAAQVYLASGDAAKAANILKRGRAPGDVSFDSFSPLPEAGEGADLLSRPELWAAVLGARRLSVHPDVLANEAVTVLESVTEATDPIFAMQVRSQSAIAFMDAGMFSAAGAILDSTKESSGTDTRSMLPILAARGVLESYLGHHDRALALWHRIRPFALYNASVFAQLTRIEVRAARQRGQWEVEYDQLQRMLHAADESRAVTIIAMALAEGVFGCWLAHESEKLDDYVAQLASLMREHELPALLNFQLASLGLQPTTRRMSNFWDAIAFLMACLREANPQRASELAETACTLADASGATYLRILARVAISEKTPSLQSEKLQESIELGNTVDSPALHESLRWIAGGSPPFGMLSAFISRFRAKGQMALEPPGIDLRIGIADATVLRAGAPISISEGGWGLLLMLSPGRPVHRDVLCDRLWPTMTLESGYNALKMCVRRTRLQLGSPDAIISTQGGYALAHWVAVDLVAMERLEDGIATGTLPETAIPQVQQYLDALRRGRPANFASWEWFSPTEQRLESIGHCFGAFLAKRAIAAADYRTAVDIADYLITLDPLDESARKLLIMAHLASGDPGAAKRELRQYSKVLRDELDAAPSAELSNLICS